MEWFVRRFLQASLVWLGAGVTLGVAIAILPALLVYRPAHLHLNLLGFMAMMVYGVGYHLLPRLSGHPLRSPRAAGAHWWLANGGLLLLAVGFGLGPSGSPRMADAARAAGGIASAIGAYLFIWNIWRTMADGEALRARLVASRAARPPQMPAPGAALPVLQEQ